MTKDEMILIKAARGYSVAQLAEYSGVPAGTIQKILSGETRNPRKATMDALERVLTGEESIYSGKAHQFESRGLSSTNDMNNGCVCETAVYGTQRVSGKKPGEYTLEDYHSLPDEYRAELIDGVLYDMDSPLPVHQGIVGLFHLQIGSYIRKNKGKCMVWLAPFDVQLDCDNRTMVEPDLVILCDEGKMRRFGLYGAPDFVLEVLSPSTRRKDMFLKTAKYENAGVREYWIVDPKNKKLIIYNYMEPDVIAQIMPIAGKKGLAIYNDELVIDLDEIAEEIEHLEKLQRD